jgi:hypothetical protein
MSSVKMTDFVFAVTVGFLMTRLLGFASFTLDRFIENDRARTNKVDKQVEEVKERMNKMETELSSIISFVTRSSYTGKGVYQTYASALQNPPGKINEVLEKMTEDDLKKFGDILDEVSIKVVQVKGCPLCPPRDVSNNNI